MTETLEELVESVSAIDPRLAYLILLVSAFLENVIPPVPGDMVVVFSAYLVGRGALEWWPVYLATCAGGTVGFTTMYLVGLRQGRAFLIRGEGRLRRRWFSTATLERAETWLERYGPWLILANRFLSGIRSVIALSAGVGGMNWRIVAGLGLVSMAIWNGLLLYAGLLLGKNWTLVLDLLQTYNRIWLILLSLVALYLLWRWWRARRSSDPPDGGVSQA